MTPSAGTGPYARIPGPRPEDNVWRSMQNKNHTYLSFEDGCVRGSSVPLGKGLGGFFSVIVPEPEEGLPRTQPLNLNMQRTRYIQMRR